MARPLLPTLSLLMARPLAEELFFVFLWLLLFNKKDLSVQNWTKYLYIIPKSAN